MSILIAAKKGNRMFIFFAAYPFLLPQTDNGVITFNCLFKVIIIVKVLCIVTFHFSCYAYVGRTGHDLLDIMIGSTPLYPHEFNSGMVSFIH